MEKLPSYNEIFTFENLYKAHLRARRGKRHKRDVILFETNTGQSIAKLQKELDKRAYKVNGYNHFVIYEPKERNIQSLHYYDRIVQHCLVDNYLMPLLERKLIYDNGACRKGKGTDFSRNRVKGFLSKYFREYGNEGYVLQFDIHHYFPSINHDVLKEKVKNIVNDTDVLNLLFSLIDSYCEEEKETGLPMGNQTSQCFALLYMDRLDRLIKEKHKMKHYSRYMDDGIIISSSKEELKIVLSDIKNECEALKLTLNEKKTRIFKLNEGFTYLGFKYCLLSSGKILMAFPKSKERRIKRFLRKKKKKGQNISISIDSIEEHARRGNEFHFVQELKRLMN